MALRRLMLAIAVAAAGLPAQAREAGYVSVIVQPFSSVLPAAKSGEPVRLRPFRMQRLPVTNAGFLEFTRAHPKWRRDRAPSLFVDEGYLRHWAAADALGSAAPQAPVVNVSWFAASAYCAAQDARLPTWHEWEWAAAADATRLDARDSPAWRQRILDWYARSGRQSPGPVGAVAANRHGLHDLHGLIWEWVQDYGAMMVSGDNREQGDPDLTKFCGTGALSMEQKENYAVLMRVALLSSLQARNSTSTLGFRCARDEPGDGR